MAFIKLGYFINKNIDFVHRDKKIGEIQEFRHGRTRVNQMFTIAVCKRLTGAGTCAKSIRIP